MPGLDTGAMDRRIRIERPVADTSFKGAGSGEYAEVATVWAEVRDILPSRGEKLADGLNVATRPARIRMRWRRGITSDMRVLLIRKVEGEIVVDRTMQIVTVPAELGRREGLEFMVEDFSTAGNPA